MFAVHCVNVTGRKMPAPKKMQSIDESMPVTKPHQIGAILSLLLAATLWGVFWYPLRLLEQHGLHGLWSTLLIYCGTLPTMLLLLRGRRGRLSPGRSSDCASILRRAKRNLRCQCWGHRQRPGSSAVSLLGPGRGLHQYRQML